MTDTKYVTVPREPTPEMIAAGRKVRQDGFSEIAIFDAMIAAAPPAASVRAMELAWIEDRFGDEFATPAADQRYTVQALADGEWLALRNGERLNGEPEDVIYGTRAAGKAACQQHFNAYVRTLLAPTVDEAAPLTESAEAPVAWMRAAGVNPQFEPAVISATVKSIWLRVKPARVERYTVPLYTHPASTNTDAGVTEADVRWLHDTILHYRNKDHERTAALERIEAALGAREGK